MQCPESTRWCFRAVSSSCPQRASPRTPAERRWASFRPARLSTSGRRSLVFRPMLECWAGHRHVAARLSRARFARTRKRGPAPTTRRGARTVVITTRAATAVVQASVSTSGAGARSASYLLSTSWVGVTRLWCRRGLTLSLGLGDTAVPRLRGQERVPAQSRAELLQRMWRGRAMPAQSRPQQV